MGLKLAPRHLSSLAFPGGAIALFSLLGLIGVLNHAMWRDEFNTWLIVRDSHSLGELLSYVTYQGHTALWALCLYGLHFLGEAPVVMQLFHLTVAIAAMILLWRYSPLWRWQKVVFTFGYLPFYEYLLIARPYVLGMASLFAFCALFQTRRKTYLGLAICLALMGNSNAYALFISGALFLTLVAEYCFDAEHRATYRQQSPWFDGLLSLLIVVAAYAFALYILMPPADSVNHGGTAAWFFEFDLKRLLRAWDSIFAGYTLVIPKREWPDLIAAALAGGLALGAIALRFLRKPWVLCFFVLANGEILAFTYLRFVDASLRHFGHYYLIVISSLWLASHYDPTDVLTQQRPARERLAQRSRRCSDRVIALVLVAQLLGGLYGYGRDWLVPFSAARATAQYIQAQGWQDAFIVASTDAHMAPIAGYLDRTLYYPELRQMGSFTLFRQARVEVDQPEILRQTQQLLRSGQVPQGRVLLVLSEPLDLTQSTGELELSPIRQFERAWLHSEHYYLYWAQ